MLVVLPSGLIAPDTYRDAPAELRSQVCNGCGPAAWRVDPIPDALAGVEIGEACDVHDWMYHEGVDKRQADEVFLQNMALLCSRGTGLLLSMRLSEAALYFLAVSLCGGPAFGGNS
ncbi:MAG: hypothetical protein AB7E51_18980 [Pseudodesulfovibrio sp.]|uniref:hypothetical protein n=1 Tax=Pseudodesulfovibrio sp. TaxID=2035812 RepID=UPI003D0EA64F